MEIEEGNIVDVLTKAGIFKSKREARELISGNALSLNNKKINDLEYIITKKDVIDNLIVIKKGKKTYYLGIMN